MPRPGVEVEVVQDTPIQGPILDTGQGFFAGVTERGPNLGIARSAGEYEDKFGGRVNANFNDGVQSFFSEGGGTAIVSRDIAADAVVATVAVGAGATVDAISAGTWGNDVDVRAVYAEGSDAAGEPIYVEVDYLGANVERSRRLASVDEMVSWAEQYSNFVRFAPTGAPALPAGGTTASLIGGTNGAAIGLTSFQAALDRFTYELGPGQVQSPGQTDPDYHRAIGVHVDQFDRCGLIDLPRTDIATELVTARTELDGEQGARALLALGSWLNYPFSTSPAAVVTPYSGVQAGIIARIDKLGDPAAVAAGSNGVSRLALGLAYDFTDADRTLLNSNGVTLGRQMFGRVRTYGYRTAAGPDIRDNWTFFQESRVIMAVAHQCNAALEEFVFDTIDGKGHLLVQAKNVLVGICQQFWSAGALFGATAADSFRVVCDFSNNPIETIRLGELHAAVYLKTSKIAEWIKVDIIKVPTEREVI